MTTDLEALRLRHLAFLEARLVSPAAEAEWPSVVAAAFADLLARPLGELVAPASLVAALDVAYARVFFDQVARPIAHATLAPALAQLRDAPGSLANRVPLATRAKIDALLERRGLVPERLIREVLEQDVVEEVLRDVLFDALREFSEKLNPIAFVKRISPLGGLGMGRGLEALKADFDRILEPEMRKFLQGFSRRALHKMADFAVARWDAPDGTALRKEVVSWILARPASDLGRTDAPALAAAHEITFDVLAEIAADPAVVHRRRALVEAFVEEHAATPVAALLDSFGVEFVPDPRPLAAATWPAVRAALGSAPVRAWLRAVVAEFYDGEIARARVVLPSAHES